jgi:hypothetical protein
MTEIEIVEKHYSNFVGEAGRPAYIEPDAKLGYEKMVALKGYLQMLEPEKTFYLYPSPHALKKGWAEIEKTDPKNAKKYSPLRFSHAKICCEIELEINPKNKDAKKDLEILNKFLGAELVFVGEKSIHISQLPTAHYCDESTGSVRHHRDDGFATEYADGNGICSIEDIVCPDWFATKFVSDVTAKDIMSLVDTDHRRIAIRKFGIAKLIAESKEIDADSEYRLLDLGKTMQLTKALYLEMTNPSTNIIIWTGVSNDCKTISDAINWRSGTDWKTGIDWNPHLIDALYRPSGRNLQRQQGDVLILEMSKSEFLSAIKTLKKVDRNFVLSPDNQRRHILVGNGEIYGDDVTQYICGYTALNHPEHSTVKLYSYQKVWAVLERDHVLGLTRAEID